MLSKPPANKSFLLPRAGRLFFKKEALALLLLPFLLFLPASAPVAEHVVIPEAGGVRLRALLFLPRVVTAPGVVALHGCAGPLPRRDYGWARLLAGQGHAVLLPDSFASRGLPGECKETAHAASAYTARRGDALAAAEWLEARGLAPAGGVLLLGWSDGGTTVLASVAPGTPEGLIRGAVAFYPACARTEEDAGWRSEVPLLILMGALDDWTPPAPCLALAQRRPDMRVVLLAGAYHDFDVPNDPVHVIHGLPYTETGGGVAHAGEDPAARAQALLMVPAFFKTLPPAAAR
jgi:dienelactone hydrolase